MKTHSTVGFSTVSRQTLRQSKFKKPEHQSLIEDFFVGSDKSSQSVGEMMASYNKNIAQSVQSKKSRSLKFFAGAALAAGMGIGLTVVSGGAFGLAAAAVFGLGAAGLGAAGVQQRSSAAKEEAHAQDVRDITAQASSEHVEKARENQEFIYRPEWFGKLASLESSLQSGAQQDSTDVYFKLQEATTAPSRTEQARAASEPSASEGLFSKLKGVFGFSGHRTSSDTRKAASKSYSGYTKKSPRDSTPRPSAGGMNFGGMFDHSDMFKGYGFDDATIREAQRQASQQASQQARGGAQQQQKPRGFNGSGAFNYQKFFQEEGFDPNKGYRQPAASAKKPSHYEVLGLANGASLDEVKKTFRQIMKENHPDRNPSPEAAARCKEVTEAYTALKKVDIKAAYDQSMGFTG